MDGRAWRLQMSMEASDKTTVEDLALTLQFFDADSMLNPERPPRGMTWREHVVNYLRVAASIEHALMVQYLFAAYSLNPGADKEEQRKIASWQSTMLSIAKEEMGHFLTVQNVLCLLGAPLELTRDYKYGDRNFHPFEFKLEPLTSVSLNRYTDAEMPEDRPKEMPLWAVYGRSSDYRKNLVPGMPHVGEVYRYILKVFDNIPDREFHEEAFQFQASWDDWGRGNNGKSAMHSVDDPRRANVIIERVATRTQAKAALRHIFEQGEALPITAMGSHFERFSRITGEFEEIQEKKGIDWSPTYRVVENPLAPPAIGESRSTITWPRSVKWAHLFDLRYRMLLSYLGHTFKLACDGSEGRLNGAMIHKVFAEMYNIKAIAGILVQLPLKDPSDQRRAGPPFSISTSLDVPAEAIERWQIHDDLIKKARGLVDKLLSETAGVAAQELTYLRSLQTLDQDTENWINQVIAGLRLGKPAAAS